MFNFYIQKNYFINFFYYLIKHKSFFIQFFKILLNIKKHKKQIIKKKIKKKQ